MARPKKNRRYRDDEKAAALAALAANKGNVLRTAKLLNIPATTITNWMNDAEFSKLGDEKKGDLADELESVAWKLAGAIESKLKSAGLRDVSVSLGIAVDKLQLLRNLPTNINRSENAGDDLSKLTDDDLARRLAEARSRAALAGAPTGSSTDSGTGASRNGDGKAGVGTPGSNGTPSTNGFH